MSEKRFYINITDERGNLIERVGARAENAEEALTAVASYVRNVGWPSVETIGEEEANNA